MTDEDNKDPHLHDPHTGLVHGVPAGAVQEDSKGLPHSERHQTETALHPDAEAGGPTE